MLSLPDITAETVALSAQIPLGHVATFGDLALAIGDTRASRAVASILKQHGAKARGWHRVVYVDGQLSADPIEQERLLLNDGIPVFNHRVDVSKFRWKNFCGGAPLLRLQRLHAAWLEQANAAANLVPLPGQPLSVAGVDISFRLPDLAVAAYVPFDRETGERMPATFACRRIPFPYIPTYLTFRELPALVDVITAVRQREPLADVLLVDGTGRLHPRGGGLAMDLGVVVEHPTVGVTKKLLAGKVRDTGSTDKRSLEWRPIELAGSVQGALIETPTKSRKPLYVSAGYAVDFSLAVQLALDWLRPNRPLLEPIYWADRLSREMTKTRDLRDGTTWWEA